MSIGITGPDLAVLSMDQSFRMLVHRNAAGNCCSFCLRAGSGSRSGVACSLDLPATFGMRCYMLVLTHKLRPFLRLQRRHSWPIFVLYVNSRKKNLPTQAFAIWKYSQLQQGRIHGKLTVCRSNDMVFGALTLRRVDTICSALRALIRRRCFLLPGIFHPLYCSKFRTYAQVFFVVFQKRK